MSPNLTLHKAVFAGDLKAVEKLLEKFEEKVLNSQDNHGNTPLHIAVMKGDKRCVQLLVKKGAQTTVRNALNWIPLHEAISYGDFDIIKILNDSLSQRIVKYIKRDVIFKYINEIKGDFSLKFEARLKDYKPTSVVGHPDVKISLTKKGLKMKVDLTIMDYFHTTPQDFHLILDFDPKNNKFITITVGELPIYQIITFDTWEQNLTEIFSRETTANEVNELMGKENISIKMDWSSKRADQPSFRKGVSRPIGGHQAQIYESQGIDLTLRTRTEHLRAREESAPNTIGQSLPQPMARNISWEEYINAPRGKFPYLGRELIETVETNRVSVVVGLAEDIQLDWKWLLKSCQEILNNKLIMFILQLTTELPKGFPVLFNFPLKASLYVKWRLISFKMVSDIDDSIFRIPDNFEEQTIFLLERDGNSGPYI